MIKMRRLLLISFLLPCLGNVRADEQSIFMEEQQKLNSFFLLNEGFHQNDQTTLLALVNDTLSAACDSSLSAQHKFKYVLLNFYLLNEINKLRCTKCYNGVDWLTPPPGSNKSDIIAAKERSKECRLYNKKITSLSAPFSLILGNRILFESPILDKEKIVYPLLLLVLDSESEIQQYANDWELNGSVFLNISAEDIPQLLQRMNQWKIDVQKLSLEKANDSAEIIVRLADFVEEISQKDSYGILTMGVRLIWFNKCYTLTENLSSHKDTDVEEKLHQLLLELNQKNKDKIEQILQEDSQGKLELYLPMIWYFIRDQDMRDEWSKKINEARVPSIQ